LADPGLPDSERVVFIEEITGASCTACPKGSAALEAILKKFPGRVLAVGIHGEFLSEPTKKSIYDFRNKKAKELENWFRPWYGKPSASINRQYVDDDSPYMIVQPEAWLAAVEKELQKPQEMSIFLKSTYTEATRELVLEVNAIPLVDLKGAHKISVYLTESGIIDGQINGPVIQEDFEFNHVLMDMLTPHNGELLGNDLTTGTSYKRTYTYTIPTKEGLFDPKRMDIIVMVNKEDGKDRHVIQAEEVHVVK
jgi:hypothetical protein